MRGLRRLQGKIENARIREALEEARYLIDRGYPKGSAISFVSNHHKLAEEERFILMRVIVASKTALSRRSKLRRLKDLRDSLVYIDGYNVLITSESLIGGYPVYLCDDGLLRDTRGIFRSYRTSPLTAQAIASILDILSQAGPSQIEVLLDQEMSLSGELAKSIGEMMKKSALPGSARTAGNVDRLLKQAEGTVLTSDGNVIDSIEWVYDLPGELARISGIKPLQI